MGTLHKTFDDSALVPADSRTTHEPAGCDPVILNPVFSGFSGGSKPQRDDTVVEEKTLE